MNWLQGRAQALLSWAARFGWGKIVAVVLVIIIGGGFAETFLKGAVEAPPPPPIRSVQIKSVADLSADVAPLSIVGTVQSTSEATVRAESSGQVIAVYHALGDAVGAGAVVAELEHSAQSAAVLQAQGAVDAAQATLNKTEGGTRSEQLAILQAADDAAKSGAVNTLLSTYATVDGAVRGTTDAFFDNVDTNSPRLKIQTTNSQLKINAENDRSQLGPLLTRESGKSTNLSTSDDLMAELTATETEVRTVRDFLDTLIAALNTGIPTNDFSASTIAGYVSAAQTARTLINGSLSSITAARQGLATADKNLQQGVAGAQSEDIAAAQAALKQSQGALAAAQAALEKAIIRAPISGTINSFSLERGDYVQATTPVLTVANNGALEVIAYVTEQDASDIRVGENVILEDGATGVVTRVAPALDPITKKIEVRIGVSRVDNSLINGQSVLASIPREHTMTTTASSTPLTIPISAIKVGTDNSVVFTVNDAHLLVAHTVTLGALLGDRVTVTDGLTSDMQIVTDARGLRDGQEVSLQ